MILYLMALTLGISLTSLSLRSVVLLWIGTSYHTPAGKPYLVNNRHANVPILASIKKDETGASLDTGYTAGFYKGKYSEMYSKFLSRNIDLWVTTRIPTTKPTSKAT